MNRKEYAVNVTKLTDWLTRAEGVLSSQLNCNFLEIRDNVQVLDVSSF